MFLKTLLKDALLHTMGQTSTKKLVKLGMKIGDNFNRQYGCCIDESHCWLIEIGNNVTLAPMVTILAHDASTKHMLGYTKIGHVKIGNNVFVGCRTIILPNVRIGNNVVIGAGSIVSKDIPDNSVAFGSPAKTHCSFDDFIEKNKLNMGNSQIYGKEWTINNPNLSNEMKLKMSSELGSSIGYIE